MHGVSSVGSLAVCPWGLSRWGLMHPSGSVGFLWRRGNSYRPRHVLLRSS